jgi:hypothetical protein
LSSLQNLNCARLKGRFKLVLVLAIVGVPVNRDKKRYMA